MDKKTLRFVSLLCLLYLWIGERSKVSGKCAGQWAIHACGGGNGKRSDSRLLPSATDNIPSRPRFDLHSLFSSSIADDRPSRYDVRASGYDVNADDTADVRGYDEDSQQVRTSDNERSDRAREILRELVQILRKRDVNRR